MRNGCGGRRGADKFLLIPLYCYLKTLRVELSPEGYPVDFKVSFCKTVHSAFVLFPGVLYELGLSGQQSEVLAVKIEVDTNPPACARLDWQNNHA